MSDDSWIRVDMTKESVSVEPFPTGWKLLGGRALSARILLTECDPTCDSLGPDNVLVLAPGVLAGTSAPTSGRLSVGGKSPLTQGIKEANVGGNPGQHLGKLGIRAVVVRGQPSDPERRLGLEIDANGARLVSADELKGEWNYPLCAELAERHPKTASFITIGPAGELQLRGASVACTDQDSRYPTRHAARGGLGAVMGSKGLKFVTIDPGKTRARQPARAKEFAALSKKYTRDYLAGPLLFGKGTSAGVPVANILHTFPGRNRTTGQSEHADSLDGAGIVESFESRGGGMHNCLTGCIVRCSNVVHDAEGRYKTSALEFETLTMLGANCDIGSWEDVADLDRLCDEIGIDTIEAGAALAIFMDAGGMEFGDVDGAKRMLREIAEGTELGRVLGDGAASIGHWMKHARLPVVRGQAIPAWDPRSLKATGVTYATSPMGADHTCGLIFDRGVPLEKLARESREAQLVHATCDASGFCQFVQPTLDDIREFYGHLLGIEMSRREIADYAWQILEDEREFNRRAGWRDEDDGLPECMRTEPIGDPEGVFDVPEEVLAQAKVASEPREALFSRKPS